MALHPMYVKGYNAGYRKGVSSGLDGSKAKLVMTHDLIFAYGVMAIVLTEKRHWKQTTVEQLINEIQDEWFHLGDGRESDQETMAEMVERRTGIRLQQMTDNIVNDAGRKEWEGTE